MSNKCFICSVASKNNKELIQHVRVVHPHSSFYECHSEDICSGKYRYNSIESFQRHRAAKHGQQSKFIEEVNEPCSSNVMDIDDQPNNFDDSIPTCESIPSLTKSNSTGDSQKSFQELMNSDLLITFSELFGFVDINGKRVADVINVFSKNFLQGESFKFLEKLISDTISSSNISEQSAHKINESLKSFSNSFESYPSKYKQLQFLTKYGKFTQPVSYTIGERKDYRVEGGVQKEIVVTLKAQFIPLRETLRSFFELNDVLPRTLFFMDQLTADTRNSNVLSNFIQGEYWQSLIKNKNYSNNERVMPLIIYFDEFEVNNPLGSHAGVNKLGGIYCSVPTLPVEFQAKIENIFLVILFNCLDRKMTKDEYILTKLIEEVTFLESTGIKFDDPDVTVYFKLALVVGDNLGVHSLLGFIEGFTANFPCRFCLINKADLGRIFNEIECILRTIENYNESIRVNDASKTGIKAESLWHSVPDFHVIEAGCVDAMHDILEGVCKYDMGYILHDYVYTKKYFSLDYLNKRINCYEYDFNDKRSKPPGIDGNHLSKKKLSLSASEMNCLMQNITLIIGDRIPVSDNLWQIVLMLRRIIQIVFSQHFQVGMCDYLGTLVSEYLATVSELGLHSVVKHHLLTHYARLMRRLGPLGRLSSMRYESKHHFNKVIAKSTTSRVNICKTIAFKNQLIFSQRLLKNETLYPTYELGPLGFKYYEIEEGVQQYVYSTKHLTFLGFKIKVQKSILVRASDLNVELFLVNKILIQKSDNSVLIFGQAIVYLYDEHLDAFQVLSLGSVTVLHVKDLYECSFTYKISLNGQTYAPKKSII